MERSLIIETNNKVDEEVIIKGWVDSLRDHGKITFLDLRDRTAKLQCVGQNLPKFTVESVVEIKGKIVKRPEKLINKDLPTGEIELQVVELKVLSLAEELPIPLSEFADEAAIQKRFDWRWIDLRREENNKIFKVWTNLEKGFRDYIYKNDYTQVYTPSFMKSASESGSEVFEVKYFEEKAYLAQSPQFYKQLAMASGIERVFMVGPVFRAEPSFTTRHMTEFTGWDFEISFIDSHHQVMDEEEKMLVSGFEEINKNLDLKLEVPTRPFPRIPMSEAKEMLVAAGITSEDPNDLSPEEERKLAELVKDKFKHDFVFVTDWPIAKRPFYHMRHEDNPGLTKSFDLLYKGLEITTGAQREHRIDILEKQAIEKKMPIDELSYYFDFFRFGCPPHGGAGIGPGRIVMQILDLKSVKEATFLPRDVNRLNP